MTTARAGVCIAGGGIIGLAIAAEMTRRGHDVTVLEAHGIGEQAAASVAAGMLAPKGEANVAHPALTELAVASHRGYPDFVADIEAVSGEPVGFDRSGTLFVAAHRDHVPAIKQLDAFHRDRGLNADRLSGPEARELEPALAPAVSAGLLLHDDWQVDPRLLLHALTAAVRQRGGTVLEQAPVRRIERRNGEYLVTHGDAATLEASAVVLAAGAWSAGIVHGEAPHLPMRPVRGEVLRLRGERLLSRVVRSPDGYLVPRATGETVIGATSEERGFETALLAGSVLDLLRDAYRVVPGIYDLELHETNVGFRPALRDHLPAMGRLDNDGLFVATGHYRNGVELAPITAQLMAELITTGRADPMLEAFSPLRFAGHAPAPTASGTGR